MRDERDAYEYIDADYTYTDIEKLMIPIRELSPITWQLFLTALIICIRFVKETDERRGNLSVCLPLRKKYNLNLNPPENAGVYERYMSGTINGDIEKLSALILELLS